MQYSPSPFSSIVGISGYLSGHVPGTAQPVRPASAAGTLPVSYPRASGRAFAGVNNLRGLISAELGVHPQYSRRATAEIDNAALIATYKKDPDAG